MAGAGAYSCILTCLNATPAARCVACHGVGSHPVPVALMGECLHARRVESRPPASFVVLGQLKIEALAVHPNNDVADASPGVQVGAKDMESPVGVRKPGEAECCSQELAALVEHELLDHLGRLEKQRMGDREAQRLRGLEVDHELELSRLLNWQVAWLGSPQDAIDVDRGP